MVHDGQPPPSMVLAGAQPSHSKTHLRPHNNNVKAIEQISCAPTTTGMHLLLMGCSPQVPNPPQRNSLSQSMAALSIPLEEGCYEPGSQHNATQHNRDRPTAGQVSRHNRGTPRRSISKAPFLYSCPNAHDRVVHNRATRTHAATPKPSAQRPESFLRECSRVLFRSHVCAAPTL